VYSGALSSTEGSAPGGPVSPAPDQRPDPLTRRELLSRGGCALGGFALAGAALPLTAAAASRRGAAINSFASVPPAGPLGLHSRPDLRIPALAVDVNRSGTAPGLIFVSPFGPAGAQDGALIANGFGQPVWEYPVANQEIYNFTVQTYQGQPVLTWWQGHLSGGHGVGIYVIANQDYEPITRVAPGNGLQADLHEFLITDRGTALVTSYVLAHVDLRSVGGSASGPVEDAVFQEVDLASGRVLLEWHSLDHIPLSESQWPLTPWPWDYVHLNAIDVDSDGQLLVSSRNTHTVYKIDRSSGAIVWRLGGRHSDFAMGPGASFAWQHDPRRQADGTLTIFDNEGSPHAGPQSRAIVLEIDEQRKTARLKRQFLHPQALQSSSLGSVQLLPNGNVFVGWGAEPFVSEFSPSGELLFDARLGDGYASYRAFRIPWSTTGAGQPAIVAAPQGTRSTNLWVSWNGDTEVARWQVLAGARPNALKPLTSVPRAGFETAIALEHRPRQVAVIGLDAAGRPLGQSMTLAV
jgi:hypothetical protein